MLFSFQRWAQMYRYRSFWEKFSIYILYIFNYRISRNYLLIHYIIFDLSKIDRYQTDVTQIWVQISR